MTDWQAWIERCDAVLKGNQITSERDGVTYRYTRPAPHVYEYQWLWDSCFHAIAYRWYDPDMARAELVSLCAGQVTDGADRGMIPHMLYWQGDGSALWGERSRSIITQPPLIAVAALRVYERAPDRDFLEGLYPAIAAYHEWFSRRRDPDGDHLVCLIHPWESGWDASPRWDAPMGLHNPTDDDSRSARHALVARLIAHQCDPRPLADAGSFCVEPVDFNAIRAADLESLAKIAQLLGEPAEPWREQARAVQAAVRRRMWRDHTLHDLSGNAEAPLGVRSCAPFVALFGGCVDDEMARALVDTLTTPAYWTTYPVPTTPADDPQFDPAHYWRGNVWHSVNWLIYQGLRRYGYHQLAGQLAQRTAALVEQGGFHEYFNPITGEGYGPSQQSWATVVLDMIGTEGGR